MNDFNKKCWAATWTNLAEEGQVMLDPEIYTFHTIMNKVSQIIKRNHNYFPEQINEIVLVKLDTCNEITKIISWKDATRIQKLNQL
jgi:hypothetical protein